MRFICWQVHVELSPIVLLASLSLRILRVLVYLDGVIRALVELTRLVSGHHGLGGFQLMAAPFCKMWHEDWLLQDGSIFRHGRVLQTLGQERDVQR